MCLRLVVCVVAAFSVASTVKAQFAIPSFTLLVEGVDDGVAPLADVYALQLTNNDASGLDITSIALDLQAAELGVSTFFVDSQEFANPSDLTFMGALPEFRDFLITDSFIVLPEGLDPLALGSAFSGEEIISNYTTAGGILVPHGDTVAIAHISVPAGEVPSIPVPSCLLGTVVFSDNSVSLAPCVPEPSTACIALIGLLGAAANRR